MYNVYYNYESLLKFIPGFSDVSLASYGALVANVVKPSGIFFTDALINNGEKYGMLHINKGKGFILDFSDKKRKDDKGVLTYYERDYLDLRIKRREYPRCSICGGYIDDNDYVHLEYYGRNFCNNCAETNLGVCDYDMELYMNRDLVPVYGGGSLFRGNIKEAGYVYVQDKNSYMKKSDTKTVSGIHFSKDTMVSECEDCGRMVYDDRCIWCSVLKDHYNLIPLSLDSRGVDDIKIKYRTSGRVINRLTLGNYGWGVIDNIGGLSEEEELEF